MLKEDAGFSLIFGDVSEDIGRALAQARKAKCPVIVAKLGSFHLRGGALISTHTAALAAMKTAGAKLGVLPIVREMQASGLTTLREIADALNARGVRTARGGQWHSSTVHNLLARFANREP